MRDSTLVLDGFCGSFVGPSKGRWGVEFVGVESRKMQVSVCYDGAEFGVGGGFFGYIVSGPNGCVVPRGRKKGGYLARIDEGAR